MDRNKATARALRASEEFDSALAAARNGRMTMSELCEMLKTVPKTVKRHVGAGLLSVEVEKIAGRPVWLFGRADVERYAASRHQDMAERVQLSRSRTGGNKLAKAPTGYVTLIEIAQQTGHSMDYMREIAKASGVPLHRGPKSVLMVESSDVDAVQNAASVSPPRPSRQRNSQRGQPIVWTEEMDADLGTASDSLLAGRWGVSSSAVRQRRETLGVAAQNSSGDSFQWTPDRDRVVGQRPDGIAAEELGCSLSQVKRRRKALGLLPFSRAKGWTAEALDLLGQVQDTEIAKTIGVQPVAVGAMRRRLGIAAFRLKGASTMKDKNSRISPDLQAKIDQCKEIVLARLRAAGIGFTSVTDEQVISFALDQLIAQAPAGAA